MEAISLEVGLPAIERRKSHPVAMRTTRTDKNTNRKALLILKK